MRRVFEVDFFAATALLQAAARAMRERGGSIVNLTSRTALVGVRGMAVAAAIVYLAGDESRAVTGASISVDGGYTAA
jgi:NAD(P)-dependent dehydrogenase (short-subunit alcohol dehydrogenase family)